MNLQSTSDINQILPFFKQILTKNLIFGWLAPPLVGGFQAPEVVLLSQYREQKDKSKLCYYNLKYVMR
jgi:hypothetical protein